MSLSRVKNRFSLLTSYVLRRSDLQAFPISLIIESTGKCNLKCPMCPREFEPYPAEDLEFELFKQIVDEVREKSALVFPWGLGEPLIHPDIFRMIEYCHQSGIYTVISTNATLLNKERGRRLIQSGLDNLIIAFDGTTPEVYEKYRKNARFEKVHQNVLDFLKLKRELNSDIFVVLQMVRLPENNHQVDEYRRMWAIDGVNEVRIKEDEIVIPGIALEERIHHDRRRNPCYQLWQGPVHIDYKGDLRPCCHMYDHEPIGNLRKSTVFELWNSAPMEKLRQAHLKGDLTDFPKCMNCHAPNPRLPVILGSFAINTEKVREWIPKVEKMAFLYRLPLFRDR